MNATTALTALCAVAWTVGFGIRLFNHDWPLGPTLDGLMVSVVGFWFSKDALKKKEAPLW